MEFRTPAHRQCYEKVLPWIKEIFGDFAIPRSDAPVVGVIIGSALAQTAIHPWGEDDATICTRACVVMGVELTPDLMLHLLQLNGSMRFGAFGVDDDGDIFFEHTIVGSTVDREELKASIMAVVTTADRYDDSIVSRWGGERALDRMRG